MSEGEGWCDGREGQDCQWEGRAGAHGDAPAGAGAAVAEGAGAWLHCVLGDACGDDGLCAGESACADEDEGRVGLTSDHWSARGGGGHGDEGDAVSDEDGGGAAVDESGAGHDSGLGQVGEGGGHGHCVGDCWRYDGYRHEGRAVSQAGWLDGFDNIATCDLASTVVCIKRVSTRTMTPRIEGLTDRHCILVVGEEDWPRLKPIRQLL